MQDDDAVWVTEVLKGLPTVPVPAALQLSILATFDAVVARRRASVIARFRDVVWPGAPAWRPAVALAISLFVGVAAGTLVPLEGAMANSNEQSASVAFDAPPSFDLDENS
jgi:hypothetical protein